MGIVSEPHRGPPPFEEDMFAHAAHFELSGRVLRGFCTQDAQSQPLHGVHPLPPGGVPDALVADTVIEAFALEVYMKCLLVLLKVKPPKTHNLVALYSALPDLVRAELRDAYAAFCRSVPGWERTWQRAGIETDFDSIMAASDEAFNEWRYLYEDWPYTEPSAQKAWLGIPIMGIVRKAILRRRPDWAVHTLHLST